jgi:hypothetical protein
LLAQQIDQVCDHFEAAWKAGQRPRIEDYLADTPEPGHGLLLCELVALETAWAQRPWPNTVAAVAALPLGGHPLGKESLRPRNGCLHPFRQIAVRWS